jgi:hypothetical protein
MEIRIYDMVYCLSSVLIYYTGRFLFPSLSWSRTSFQSEYFSIPNLMTPQPHAKWNGNYELACENRLSCSDVRYYDHT